MKKTRSKAHAGIEKWLKNDNNANNQETNNDKREMKIIITQKPEGKC